MKKLRDKIAIETLKYALVNKWESISVDQVLKKLKINKKKISNLIKNEQDLLKNINRYFDDQILESSKLLEQTTSKDMIFEILMMRFDLLNQHRKSIKKIFNVFIKKPQKFFSLLPSFIESMISMSNISHIKIEGIVGNIKIKGLLIIYFSTFLVWTKDESNSLDKITAISGSGPAYYFIFIEYLETIARELGITSINAKKLVYQTALGSIELLVKDKRNAKQLKESIAIKGGTTEAAFNVFEKKSQFKKIIKKAIKAAYYRSIKLGKVKQ